VIFYLRLMERDFDMRKILVLMVLFLTGCANATSSDVFVTEKITAPKTVVISAYRAPWVFEIEKRLRKNGFAVKRMASQNIAVQDVTDTKTVAYNEAAARYILLIDGFAPNDSMNRCYGGGYRFSFIDVELIDAMNNETIFHYSNSGYSEGCPPLSGTIFTDIENLMNNVWEK